MDDITQNWVHSGQGTAPPEAELEAKFGSLVDAIAEGQRMDQRHHIAQQVARAHDVGWTFEDSYELPPRSWKRRKPRVVRYLNTEYADRCRERMMASWPGDAPQVTHHELREKPTELADWIGHSNPVDSVLSFSCRAL